MGEILLCWILFFDWEKGVSTFKNFPHWMPHNTGFFSTEIKVHLSPIQLFSSLRNLWYLYVELPEKFSVEIEVMFPLGKICGTKKKNIFK